MHQYYLPCNGGLPGRSDAGIQSGTAGGGQDGGADGGDEGFGSGSAITSSSGPHFPEAIVVRRAVGFEAAAEEVAAKVCRFVRLPSVLRCT